MRKRNRQKQSDFWWLTPDKIVKYKYVALMYQEPYSDEPDSDRQPLTVPKFHSLDASGNLSKLVKRYPIEFIDKWRKKCANMNVFRSLNLFSAEHGGDEILGPFLIDIDRQDESNKGFVTNFDEALEDTRQLVKKYLYKLKKEDFRIFFSGHKGFHIEVRPQVVGVVSLDNQWQQFKDIRDDINRTFRVSFADRIKEYIRLHDSINCWIANDGRKVNRIKLELSLHELDNLSAEDICTESEKLASNSLY